MQADVRIADTNAGGLRRSSLLLVFSYTTLAIDKCFAKFILADLLRRAAPFSRRRVLFFFVPHHFFLLGDFFSLILLLASFCLELVFANGDRQQNNDRFDLS